MNLPVVVTTCNKYDWLLRGFAERFNKFWDKKQPVQVLCYRDIKGLPQNFVPWIVGKEEDNPAYTYMIGKWLTHRANTGRVILMLDDYYLNRPVNTAGIEYLNLLMERDENIAKFHLDDAVQRQDHFGKQYPLVEMTQTAAYRASLQAAIWRVDYLGKLCKEDRTPWEFEIKGRQETVNDGKRIMGSMKPVMAYDNVMQRGSYVGR